MERGGAFTALGVSQADSGHLPVMRNRMGEEQSRSAPQRASNTPEGSDTTLHSATAFEAAAQRPPACLRVSDPGVSLEPGHRAVNVDFADAVAADGALADGSMPQLPRQVFVRREGQRDDSVGPEARTSSPVDASCATSVCSATEPGS
jgi:hypothetical protein